MTGIIITYINAPEGCRHGTHTNGTAYIRGTYSRVHTQTHTNTHKHKQTHNVARQSTVRTHAVAAPSSSEEGASPPPPASCISVAISHAEAMCTATDRRCVKRCACPARATSTSTSSLRSRTAVSLACSAPCPASVGRARPHSRWRTAPGWRTTYILTARPYTHFQEDATHKGAKMSPWLRGTPPQPALGSSTRRECFPLSRSWRRGRPPRCRATARVLAKARAKGRGGQ